MEIIFSAQSYLLSDQFSRSVVSDSFQHHGLQHTRLPCPSATPGVYSNSCPLSWWCHPTISSTVIPFSSCPQSFPGWGSFQMSQFASGGQSMGVSASASVLPMNIQDWFPLGWTGWISLPSKRLSRIFSNTTFQKLQLFGALVVKNMPASAGDTREVGSIHRLGRSPGGGPNNPLQCSCLANPLDRGAWWAVVHRVTKNSDMNKPLSNNSKFLNILSSVHQHLIIVVEVLKDFEKIIIWQSTPTGRLICVHRRYLVFFWWSCFICLIYWANIICQLLSLELAVQVFHVEGGFFTVWAIREVF